MSWSINSIGKRPAVVAAVNANTTMPETLKSAIVAILVEPGNGNAYANPPAPHDSARVQGHGHSGGGYGSIGKLEVELFTQAVEPAPVVEAPAAEAAAPVDTAAAPETAAPGA